MNELVLTLSIGARVREVGAGEWLATVVVPGSECAGRGATPKEAVEDLQRWLTRLQPKPKEGTTRG